MRDVTKEVEALLGKSDRIDISLSDPKCAELIGIIRKAEVRLELTRKNIVVDFPLGGKTMTISRHWMAKPASATPAAAPTTAPEAPKSKGKRSQHTYIAPAIANDLIAVLADEASHVVWLTGPTQCGKTTLVRYVAGKMGRKLYQINCRGDMGSEAFFGEKTITVDSATKQNVISFQVGTIEQAMKEGLDAQGNEVGEPGILFIDEAATMPAHVAIGVNRLLESDDPRRTLVINEDGGRIVRSHSKFRIVLAANTVGRGAVSSEAAAYTAQMDALDISLLNRVAVTFRMGYDREIERRIVLEKVANDKIASLIIKFRDAIRGHLKVGKLTSPFSTKRLVDIANMYRVFGDLGKAIYYTTFEHLLPEERPVYNETAMAITGNDLMASFVAEGIDY